MKDDSMRDYLAELNPPDEIRALFLRHGMVYRWAVLLAVMLASLSTILSSTIINVAIPDIMGTYGIGQDKAQWLATANLAAATVGMLITAWLSKTFGLKRTVVGSMLVFLFSCILGGLAPNLDVMIAARILQGIPTGVITPIGMSIIFLVFPRREQGFAMGIISIGVVVAPAVGPAVGGYLVDEFNWRFVFYMGIPFSLLCIPASMIYLPKREEADIADPMDWLGLTLATVAITAALVGLSDGQREGWSSDYILACFFVAFLSCYAFLRWQNKAEYPLLDLSVFTYLQFSVIVAVVFVVGAGIYGSTYIVPLFMQLIQGMSALDAGIALIPAGLTMAFLMPVAGRMSDMLDHRIMIASGIAIVALSFVFFAFSDANTAYWTYAMLVVFSRVGISLIMVPVNLSALQCLPPEKLQQGSGAFNFVRQLGGAFGVNLVAVSLTIRTSFHMDGLSAAQSVDNHTANAALSEIMALLETAGLTVTEQAAIAGGYLAQLNALEASTLGFQDANLLVALTFLLMLPLLLLIRKTPVVE